MMNNNDKTEVVEAAVIEQETKEQASLKYVVENGIKKVKLNEFHSTEYIKKLKETTYKDDKKVVFILPNGKEVK